MNSVALFLVFQFTTVRKLTANALKHMKHLWSGLVVVGTLLISVSAVAAPSDDAEASVESTPATAVSDPLHLPTGERLMTLTANTDDGEQSAIERGLPPEMRRDPRRAVLSSLHLATGVVQGYDGFLTLRVLRAGGIETNPLIKPMATNKGAMMAVKAAAAVSTVIGAESLWRNDHKIGAIVASVVANGAMVMVARHNAKVLATLEGRR